MGAILLALLRARRKRCIMNDNEFSKVGLYEHNARSYRKIKEAYEYYWSDEYSLVIDEKSKKIINKTGNMLMPLKKEEGIIVDFVSSILIFLILSYF